MRVVPHSSGSDAVGDLAGPGPSAAVPGVATRPWLARVRSSTLVREAISLPTLVLVIFCVLVGLPLTILLAPPQQVTIAGQHLSVGARTPSLTLAGPAQLVQIGNTELDIDALQVYGPLRPRLILGPVQRDSALAALNDADGAPTQATAVGTISEGFLRWYGWATLVLLGFTAAAIAIAGCVRLLVTLWQVERRPRAPGSTAVLWRHSLRQLNGMAIVAVSITLLAWAAAGALAYDGAARGLQTVRSLPELVGTYRFSPSPVGPKVRGYAGAVIGDSRASRLGGPIVAGASDEDKACNRSADSLAVELGRLTGEQVLNLACSGASISQGLRGPQEAHEREIPSQVGRLKQTEDLRYVVVVVGPNDLYWQDFLLYCYGVANCQDRLTQGEFAYRLAAFDRDYGQLLQDLNELPDDPQVIVMTSYDAFPPAADCPDTWGPANAAGLSPDDLLLLDNMNRQLNEVLLAGAEKYDFTVANPRLTRLCEPAHAELGPDLQSLDDQAPFHPTAAGVLRLASAVAQVIEPPEQQD